MGVFLCLNIGGKERKKIANTGIEGDSGFAAEKYEPIIKPRYTLNTFMLSAGNSNMYDTYLSPLEYTGFSIHLMYESMRDTYWLGGNFRKQQLIEAEFARGKNSAQNVNEYWGRFRYQLGGHYTLYHQEALRLGVGGFWDINVGGLYNSRNGNNPATARLYTNLNLSAIASYKWKNFAFRWQMDTPFLGILFSPKYGQSYYEISLGNTVGLVNFASLHNQRSLRNLITVDFPLKGRLFRVGYMANWYQTKVNSIQTHHYTHSFVLGFPISGIKKEKIDRPENYNPYWD